MESGITNIIPGQSYFSQHEYVDETFKEHEEKLDKVVFNLNHLEAGFVIWLTSLLSTILVFIIEKVYFYFSH